ncbi:hypothetical protein N7495_002969 [Penicillium taxi]|uniref:uncharacterized protein n=1 Tax=Penicillium taxi TaxID=168475 RepID=UPI0025451EC8|nr:uncharacterized protein N7495_002969 [Penicillium taxi]KAJ5902441.1 hypothetical protein N7495_002969 [Penicillium taxi]
MANDQNPHGKKRPAECDPDGEQPLTKKFGFLQIGRWLRNERVVADERDWEGLKLTHSIPGNEAPLSASVKYDDAISSSIPFSQPQSDIMLLDDTEHTTYIYDLDKELAEPESPRDQLVILPLAARIISAPVRESVLSNPVQGKELVLYSEPASLTVPKEHDSVRRAIIESRARARAERKQADLSDNISLETPPTLSTEMAYVDDPMDIE